MANSPLVGWIDERVLGGATDARCPDVPVDHSRGGRDTRRAIGRGRESRTGDRDRERGQ